MKINTTTVLLLAAGAYLLTRPGGLAGLTGGAPQPPRQNTITFPIGGTQGGVGVPWENVAIQGAVQLGTAAINKIPWGDIFSNNMAPTWPVGGGDFYL